MGKLLSSRIGRQIRHSIPGREQHEQKECDGKEHCPSEELKEEKQS